MLTPVEGSACSFSCTRSTVSKEGAAPGSPPHTGADLQEPRLGCSIPAGALPWHQLLWAQTLGFLSLGRQEGLGHSAGARFGFTQVVPMRAAQWRCPIWARVNWEQEGVSASHSSPLGQPSSPPLLLLQLLPHPPPAPH